VSDAEPSRGMQLLGSILVAIAIVALTIALVTAKIGPGVYTREKAEEREDVIEERQELQEERQELQEERREEQEDND
jgi:type II secretory pathway pseudopilin PulG